MGGILKKKKKPATAATPAPEPVVETPTVAASSAGTYEDPVAVAAKATDPIVERDDSVEGATKRAEARAEAEETTEMKRLQRRRRLRRRGGMRLLFSPLRREGPGFSDIRSKLGG